MLHAYVQPGKLDRCPLPVLDAALRLCGRVSARKSSVSPLTPLKPLCRHLDDEGQRCRRSGPRPVSVDSKGARRYGKACDTPPSVAASRGLRCRRDGAARSARHEGDAARERVEENARRRTTPEPPAQAPPPAPATPRRRRWRRQLRSELEKRPEGKPEILREPPEDGRRDRDARPRLHRAQRWDASAETGYCARERTEPRRGATN